jgi:hypothetical protein
MNELGLGLGAFPLVLTVLVVGETLLDIRRERLDR